jgi:hypothetical protein
VDAFCGRAEGRKSKASCLSTDRSDLGSASLRGLANGLTSAFGLLLVPRLLPRLSPGSVTGVLSRSATRSAPVSAPSAAAASARATATDGKYFPLENRAPVGHTRSGTSAGVSGRTVALLRGDSLDDAPGGESQSDGSEAEGFEGAFGGGWPSGDSEAVRSVGVAASADVAGDALAASSASVVAP